MVEDREHFDWLRSRGLRKLSKLNAAEELGVPLVGPRGGAVEQLQAMVVALTAMLAQLMDRTVTEESILEAERRIKIFLTLFHRVDQRLKKEKDDPAWVSSYNFSCLLNLPGMMREFGPLRNLWEGGCRGEGILTYVKPELTMGLRLNWQRALMKKILQQKSMGHLLPKSGMPSGERTYFRYRGLGPVLTAFSLGRPLSAVCLSDGRVGCVLLVTGELVPLRRVSFVEELCGMFYHEWALCEADESGLYQTFQVDQIIRSVLLLPMLTNKGLPSENCPTPAYTAIDSEWKEIGEDGISYNSSTIPH